MLINSVPLKPHQILPNLQKFPLTILFAISAVLFIAIAIVVMNQFLADSAVGGGLSNPEQVAKANILRISMWAMGGLFLALSGFVIVADVIIFRSNRREVALAAARLAERERFEEQLLQVQKMESIGRLAGGVAHDFNNLLTPIISYAQLCKMNLDADDPLYSNLEEIEKAADRAADVTHKLLAFSRQQVIEPQDIDLNRLVVDLGKMLHRLIDENVKMSIITAPDAGLVKSLPLRQPGRRCDHFPLQSAGSIAGGGAVGGEGTIRGATASGAENGEYRAAGGRSGSRFQQPAHTHN